MKKSVIILIAVVAVIVIWAISAYNGLVSMDENVTYRGTFVILSYVAREKIKNPKEMRYAEVSELADEQD